MSENKIIELHTEQEPKRAPGKRKILLFAALALAAALVLVFVLLDETLNLDRVRRYFTYLTTDKDSYGNYSFDADNTDAYVGFDNGLAVASQSGLSVYAPNGEEVGMTQISFTTPAVAAGRQLIVGYDVGGMTIAVMDNAGQTLLKTTAEGGLVDLDVSESGYVCYCALADGYKTLLKVLDPRQQTVYTFGSNTQYFSCCAVSENGKVAAAVGLGQEDTAFCSTAVILHTDEEEIRTSLSLGNQLIYDLQFMQNGNICAIGEASTVIFTQDGKLVGRYDYEGRHLADFVSDGDTVVLSLAKYTAGNEYSIVTLSGKAQLLASKQLDKLVMDLDVADKYVAVLTSDALTIYSRKLEPYDATADPGTAGAVIIRSDATAILIGAGRGILHIPG